RDCVPVVGENGETSGRCLPVAAPGKRVDRGTPVFSDPLTIDNPLHPTTEVAQTILGGQVDGAPFRTEVTLLPDVKTITWKGHRIKAVTSQYLAFSDGRIHEVALDWYAQADDGSVWYLGEDVFNYQDGVVADTEGTWVAGDKAPAAMIMPATPDKGDVYRPENVPGAVFEEVTVGSVNETVTGPSGPIKGAIVVDELHMDGSHESKTFAPGYGEFATGTSSGDLEAVSLALPTDAAKGPVPDELNTMATLVRNASDAAASKDWTAATKAAKALTRAWAEFQPGDAPLKLLRTQTDRDIDVYAKAVAGRDADTARDAALRIAQDHLDLVSRYQPVTTTDLARMRLWADQLRYDAAARDKAAVAGDVATLKWTFDRVRGTVADPEAVDDVLAELRTAARSGDLAATGTGAAKLSALLR
ncbi:MAG: hypothetical protein ACRDTU_20475, partial [Micromonosporaceae bacterium]